LALDFKIGTRRVLHHHLSTQDGFRAVGSEGFDPAETPFRNPEPGRGDLQRIREEARDPRHLQHFANQPRGTAPFLPQIGEQKRFRRGLRGSLRSLRRKTQRERLATQTWKRDS
jgi:hypothetical protein